MDRSNKGTHRPGVESKPPHYHLRRREKDVGAVVTLLRESILQILEVMSRERFLYYNNIITVSPLPLSLYMYITNMYIIAGLPLFTRTLALACKFGRSAPAYPLFVGSYNLTISLFMFLAAEFILYSQILK